MNHKVTTLIVEYYHCKYLHGKLETVVNEIRQRIYIGQLRTVARNVAKRFQWCKVYQARPTIPLPVARLFPDFRPFTYIGVD